MIVEAYISVVKPIPQNQMYEDLGIPIPDDQPTEEQKWVKLVIDMDNVILIREAGDEEFEGCSVIETKQGFYYTVKGGIEEWRNALIRSRFSTWDKIRYWIAEKCRRKS